MPKLSKYNTLTEALAFNLTDKDIRELGYTEKTTRNEYMKSNKDFMSVVDYSEDIKSYNNTYYNYWSIKSNSNLQLEYIPEYYDTLCFLSSSYSYNMFYWDPYNYNEFYVKRGLIRKEINLTSNHQNTTLYRYIKNGVMVPTTKNYLKTNRKLNFGNYGMYYTDYGIDNYNSNNFLGLDFNMFEDILNGVREQITDKSYRYNQFIDFRWLPNLKIILKSEILDKSFYNISNLIPEGTILFIVDTADRKTKLEAELPTLKDNIKTYEDIKEVYKRIANIPYDSALDSFEGVVFAYKRLNRLYVVFNIAALNMFYTNEEQGEDLPLDENGYIAWDKIDYRKKYTNALGAARLNPYFVHKIFASLYTDMKIFTNKPDNTQGVPYDVSISQQMFKTGNNEATLTVTLGHTIVNGVTYNDELVSVYSLDDLVYIQKQTDTTWTISFKSTTTVKDDRLIVKIKNTFTGVHSEVYYDLYCVLANQHEIIKSVEPSYRKNVSACNTINGYILYERDTALSQTDLDNLNQANTNSSQQYLIQNFVNITKPNKFEPINLTAITAQNKQIMLRFKGKTLGRIDNSNNGTYTYNFQTKNDKELANLVIMLDADIYNNPTPPRIDPVRGEPNPPGSGGGIVIINPPGGGGSGGGNSGGGSSKKDDGNNKDETPTTPEKQPEYDCLNVNLDEDGFLDLNSFFDIETVVITSMEELLVEGNMYKNYNGEYAYYWNGKGFIPGVVGKGPAGQIEATSGVLIPKITRNVMYQVRRKGSSDTFKNLTSYSFWQYRQTFTDIGTGEVVEGGDDLPVRPSNIPYGDIEYYNNKLDSEEKDNIGQYEIIGINFNDLTDTSGLKYRLSYEGFGLNGYYGKVDFADISLCVYFKALSRDEYNNIYQNPADFNTNYTVSYGTDQYADVVKNELPEGTPETEQTYKLNSNFVDFNPVQNLGKKLPYGDYQATLSMTDINGNTVTTTQQEFHSSSQTSTLYFKLDYDTTLPFDKTQVKSFNVNVISFTDNTGGKVL